LVLAALVAAVVMLHSKAAYLVYAAAWAATAGALMGTRRAQASAPTAVSSPAWALLSVAGFVATLAAAVAVAWHWGGKQALTPALFVAVALSLVMLFSAPGRVPSWPADWRWQAQLMGALLAVAALVGVFSGGAYMGGRMKASAQDSQDRTAHWSKALSLLSTADWAIGKGLGRYWANQSLSGQPNDQTGDYRWLPLSAAASVGTTSAGTTSAGTTSAGTDGAAAVLTSGRHELGSGEALRLSQRVATPLPGPVTLRLKVRTTSAIKLQAEVCEKHLLYPAGCVSVEHPLAAPAAGVGAWQPVELQLKGDVLGRGAGWVPRSTVFSLSLGTHQTRAEIDALSLQDAQGRELLHNGEFEQGLARWYFSSDRYHLPWHAKNLVVHLLFEQGLLGLGAFVLLVGAALWRVCAGAARGHMLAPALAAGCVGLLVVGLVDSLLDMPRIAFLTLLLLTVMLTLPAPRQNSKPA
jgi:hypothetical protein